jgi:hypothetical protein
MSRATEMAAGQGLQTGAVIKIPLAPGEATPIVADVPTPAAVAGQDPVEATLAGPETSDADTLERTNLRLDAEKYPQGLVCVARTSERETVTLTLYDSASADESAVAVYESRRGQVLRELAAEDMDGDGVQEIYTIWQSENEGPLSRILRVEGNRIEVVCETPNDPVAMARLRARDSR